MLARLKNHLALEFPFLEDKKLLLATSGGLDSMVMVHLFFQLGYKIALAHCNFQLRGQESFDDQKFVQNFASAKGLPFFTTEFDTKAFAKEKKVSTQVAARELRYNWFESLLETEKRDYILTAHQADDVIETFFINLSRGTGIEGLTGIPAQNGAIMRPLLPFSRKELELYAEENAISWREDSSNAQDAYLRNKIRHKILPLLKELNPKFISSFQKTQSFLQKTSLMEKDVAALVYTQVAHQKGDEIYFDILKIKQLANYKSYLYQWLYKYGFSAWEDVYALVEAQSGKQIYSPEYRLLKNRDFLILSPTETRSTNQEYLIYKEIHDVKIPLNISFCKVKDIATPSNSAIFVDEDELIYPLLLCRWKQGDSFLPAGMNGKSKKVSKFFKDEKLSLLEKENCWVLKSNNTIVWIVGYRQDQRYKATSSTTNILKIEIR